MIADPTNKIQQYINAWYLNVVKGVDYLLLFKKHIEWSLVTRLIIHLQGNHNVIFNENEDLVVVAECAARQRTTLIAYFAYKAQNANGWNVVYADFPVDHVWKIQKKVWSIWRRREKGVGQIFFMHLAIGECFFLCLLIIVCNLFRRSLNCWWHRVSDISSYLRSTRISAGSQF